MPAQPRPPGDPLHVRAKKHLGAAPGGGSRAQRYEVIENGKTYVVKLKGNPGQGIRVLFNEYVSGRLGELIGVPFGEHALVSVPDALYPSNLGQKVPGIQVGTEEFKEGQTDLTQLRNARNFNEFPSVLVFDTFIARRDSRQYLVYPSSGDPNSPRDMGAIYDQRYAFTGEPNWSAASLSNNQNCTANNGLHLKQSFPGISAYEPSIRRVEALSEEDIRKIIDEGPLTEWQISQQEANALAQWLNERKRLVRAAIDSHLR